VKLTYLPFIVQVVVESLKEHRVLNSVWDGDRIVLRKRINIGVAVELEDSLIVPVIHDVDGLTFLGLVRAINDQVRRARTGKLRPDDIAGGTFNLHHKQPGLFGLRGVNPDHKPPAGSHTIVRSHSKAPGGRRRRPDSDL
jgi:2-oxoisovalerate dehydrogenase E2 component (dihydrolipoyl transacylase)